MVIKRSVRALVLERDQGVCQWCGQTVRENYSLQHRRARGMGGSKRPETDGPQNLITVCGSGTTLCHGRIESHPSEATSRGFRLNQQQDPAAIAVQTWAGAWLFLEPDGSVTPAFPPEIS